MFPFPFIHPPTRPLALSSSFKPPPLPPPTHLPTYPPTRLVDKYDDLEFFMSKSMNPDAGLIFCYYKDGVSNPSTHPPTHLYQFIHPPTFRSFTHPPTAPNPPITSFIHSSTHPSTHPVPIHTFSSKTTCSATQPNPPTHPPTHPPTTPYRHMRPRLCT